MTGEPEADPIDVEALGRYLEAAIEGFSGLRVVSKFRSGQSNPTYLLKADSVRLVLRAKPPGAPQIGP